MTKRPVRQGGQGSRQGGLAVFGGSFNPPHTTHRRLVLEALRQLPVDRVLVVPSGDHPHKQNRDMAPAPDRLAMCRLAFAGMPHVEVDDRELRRRGPSFTVDTLRELAAEFPGTRLYFLIGSDNLPLLPTWREPEAILALATVVTWPRLHHPISQAVVEALPLSAAAREQLAGNALAMAPDAVAASDVRRRWRAGERDLPELDPAVRDYMQAHGLYR